MRVSEDKIKHFAAGVLIAAVVDYALSAFGYSLNCAIAAGIIVSMLCGATKELVWDDVMGMGQPDIFDFLATMAGGLAISPIIVYILR